MAGGRKNQDGQLVGFAMFMKQAAYAPYSNFRVGAALLGTDGSMHTGCNIENAAYPATMCAERVAAAKAISNGCRKFQAIAVSGDSDEVCVPCGVCLQFLSEFAADDMRVICINKDGSKSEIYTLNELLPHAFKK